MRHLNRVNSRYLSSLCAVLLLLTGCSGGLSSGSNSTFQTPETSTNSDSTQQQDETSSDPKAGSCGSANGVALTQAPTTGLCAVGSPSSVSGTNPFTWNCQGLEDGPSVSCSAPYDSQASSGTSADSCTANSPTVFQAGQFQYAIVQLNGSVYQYCGSHNLRLDKFHMIVFQNDANIYQMTVSPIGFPAPSPYCGAMPGYTYDSHKALGYTCVNTTPPGPAGMTVNFRMKDGSTVPSIRLDFNFF